MSVNTGARFLVETSSLTRVRRAFPLKGEVVKIGRAGDNTVVVADHSVSKTHAAIYPLEGKLVVRDLGSRNGTYVNGERVTEHALGPNDEVRIGTSRFRLADTPPPAKDEETGRTVAGASGDVRESRRLPSGPIGLTPTPPPGQLGAMSPADAIASIDRLWAILRVQRRVTDPIELMSGLLNYLIDVLEADRGAVVIVEEGGTTPTLRVDGDRGTAIHAEPLDLRARPFARALDARETVAVDAGAGADPAPTHVLVVPIWASAHLLGAAFLDRAPPASAFSMRHVKVAELATALAGPRILDTLSSASA